MAEEKKGRPQEDAILARLKGSGQTPTGVTSFVGLLGKSPKPGYWLLYLSLDMSRSVEINEDDIVHSEQLPAERSPFGSLGGTRVFVKKDAQVTSVQTSSQTKDASAAADEFDLDIRLGGGAGAPAPAINTVLPQDPAGRVGCVDTNVTACSPCQTRYQTLCLGTCKETCAVTCHTCNTLCAQHTCANTCANTCPNTCANTCATCNTQCGQNTCANTCAATCHTCNTQCGQHTCAVTCVNTCANTCHTCVTCVQTCVACTHATCLPHCSPQ